MDLIRSYDWYLARNMLAGTLLAFVALFSIDSVIDLINDLELLDKRGFTVQHVVLKLFLGMPQRLYDLMPTSLLLGTLIGLGNLAARGELEAMRSVGISRMRILWSVLAVGTVLVVISMGVGETVAPTTEGYLRSLHKSSDMHKISIRSRHGQWVRDGNRFINIKQMFTDRRMADIWVYEMDADYALRRVSFARDAVYEDGVWKLSQVRHDRILQDGVETSEMDEETWQRLVSPELFKVVSVKPEHMAAGSLKTYIEYLDANGLDSRRYQLAYFNRFAVPLSGLAMLLLAVPFVFLPLRTGGLGQRLVLGIGIAVVFDLLSRVLGNGSVVYGMPPLVGAFSPVLLVSVVATVVYRKLAWI